MPEEKPFPRDSRQDGDMTQGGIISKIVVFAIPLLFGNLFQQLYHIINSAVVGRFCEHTALSAVGTAGTPMQILVALFLGIGTGVTILVSQFRGAGDFSGIRNTVRTGGSFLMLSALPLTVVGIIVSPAILRFMNTPDDVMAQAITYLSIIFLGTLANLGYNMNAGILRGIGDSRAPLKFLIVSCGINIVLDLLFVIVFSWDVAGVAVATVIAQFVAWLHSIIYIKKHYPEMELKIFQISFDKGLLKHIVRLGLPLGFNNSIFALGFLLMGRLVNLQGSIFTAGVTAAGRIDSLIFLPITSFAAAATTFAGQNSGAFKHDRLKKGFWQILGITVATNVALAVVVLSLGRPLMAIFTKNQEIIDVGIHYMWWLVPFYWIYCIFAICSSYMNGVGEVRVPTIASLFMFWGIRLPVANLLFKYFGKFYIYACYPISWSIGALILFVYFLSGHWRRHYLAKAGGGDDAPDGETADPSRTEIYFVRHCQSDSGIKDDMARPLTPKGMEDSRRVTDFFDSRAVDKLFSSPMKRAVDTILDMATKWGHPIEIIDGFAERRMPDEPVEDFAEFARRQWADIDYAPQGGESLRDVQRRCIAAIDEILRLHRGQTSAVACHGTMLCAIVNHYRPEFGYEDYLEASKKQPWVVRMLFADDALESMELIDII